MVGNINNTNPKYIEIPILYNGLECCTIKIETLLKPICVAHMDVTNFNHNIFKTIKKDINELIPKIKSLGYKQLMVSSYNGCNIKKWKKFVALLGFSEPINYFTAIREL